MSSKRELSVQKRASILTLAEERYTVREIALRLKIAKSTVHDTIKKYATSTDCSSKKRTGRPAKTTKSEDRFIETISKRNRRLTASEITAEVNRTRQDSISVATVKRRLVNVGLRGCVAVKKPFLRPINKRKRFNWAKEHKDWTISTWENVLWTDESKFGVFGNKRRQFVRRKPNEKLLDDCVVPTVKHGGGSVTVWGCFGKNMVGDIVKIDGILRKEQYLNILIEHAVPSGSRLIGSNFIFMQDNDPKHTAKLCKNYLETLERENALKIMHWPPQSPDLNPIEKLWDELDRKVREKCPTSQKDLWKYLQETWKEISIETMRKLVERLPRLVQAVISNRGGYVDESRI